jgi:hypothetical protein
VPTREWTSIVVTLALSATIAIVVVVSLVRGTPIDEATLESVAGGVGSGVLVAWLLLTLFDRRLWRVPAVHRVLPDAQPVLHGTWAVHVVASQRRDRDDPIELAAFLVIKQRYSAVTTKSLFHNGASKSMVASMERDQHAWQLWFFYDFQPTEKGAPDRRRGAAELEVRVDPELRLEGRWWNERGDIGSVRSVHFFPCEFIDDFHAAEARLNQTLPRLTTV